MSKFLVTFLLALVIFSGGLYAQDKEENQRYYTQETSDKLVVSTVYYPVAMLNQRVNWIPLTIKIVNNSDQRLKANIVVSTGGLEYKQEMEVGQQSPFRVQMCVQCNGQDNPMVSITSEQYPVMLDKRLPMAETPIEKKRILILGPKPRALPFKNENESLIWDIFYPQTADLFPEHWYGYRNVSEVMILDCKGRYQLSPEQERALREWVVRGGSVFFVMGDNWQVIMKSGLASLVPAKVEDAQSMLVQQRILDWMETVGTPSAKLKKIVQEDVTRKEPTKDTVVLVKPTVPAPNYNSPTKWVYLDDNTDRKIPLMFWGDVGKGSARVLTIGLNSKLMSYFEVQDQDCLGNILFSTQGGGRNDFTLAERGNLVSQLAQSLNVLFKVKLPATKIIVVVLLAYLFFLGPIEWIIVRRYGWGRLGWLFYIVLATAFALTSYYWGNSYKENQAKLAEASVIHVNTDMDFVTARTSITLYSTKGVQYQTYLNNPQALPESFFLQEANNKERNLADKINISANYIPSLNLKANPFDYMSMEFDWSPRNVNISAQELANENAVRIANDSKIPLYDCIYVTPNEKIYYLGNADADTTKLSYRPDKPVSTDDLSKLFKLYGDDPGRAGEKLRTYKMECEQAKSRQAVLIAWILQPLLLKKDMLPYEVEAFNVVVIPVGVPATAK